MLPVPPLLQQQARPLLLMEQSQRRAAQGPSNPLSPLQGLLQSTSHLPAKYPPPQSPGALALYSGYMCR